MIFDDKFTHDQRKWQPMDSGDPFWGYTCHTQSNDAILAVSSKDNVDTNEDPE